MKLSVISLCSHHTAETLLAASERSNAQSHFLKLDWRQYAALDDLQQFLPALQKSVNENAVTVVFDGTSAFYTKNLISQGLGMELQEDALCRKALETFCKNNQLPCSGSVTNGARIPDGSVPMCSSHCANQGFILTRGGCCIVVFPISENSSVLNFELMFSNGFFPFLLRNSGDTAVTQTTAIRSDKVDDVNEYLRLFKQGKNILPLVYEEDGHWNFSVTAIRSSEAESRQACESLLEDIQAEMGEIILTKFAEKKQKQVEKIQNYKYQAKNSFKDFNLDDEEKPKYRAMQASNQPDETKKRRRFGFGFIKTILFGICVCTFLVSAGYLGLRYYNSIDNSKKYDDLQEVYENGGFPSMDYPSDYDKAFSGLYQINQDIVGWLTIDDTNINYPVVQADDNDYYHRLSFRGDYSLYGVPFVDYRVDLKNGSTNTIIYGHNIKNDEQMFNPLIHYSDVDFYKKHPIVNFHTVYGERKYKIFAMFITNASPTHGEVFPYHNFIDANDISDVQEHIYNVQIRSLIDTGVDVLPSDELLTLSTCTYEFENARFVVLARLLRDGESEDIDKSAVSKAKNPLMPDIWYELYGGEKPVLSVPTFSDVIVLDGNPNHNLQISDGKEDTEEEIPENDEVIKEETPKEEVSEEVSTEIPKQEIPEQVLSKAPEVQENVIQQNPNTEEVQKPAEKPAETPVQQETTKQETQVQQPQQSQTQQNQQSQTQTPAQKPAEDVKQPAVQEKEPEKKPNAQIKVEEDEKEDETQSQVNFERIEEDGESSNQVNIEYVDDLNFSEEKEDEKKTDEEDDEPKENVNSNSSQNNKKEESNDDDDDKKTSYDDSETLSVKINGKKVTDSAYNIVAKMVQAEVGASFEVEAIKAQAVAAYTYVKYNNKSNIAPSVAANSTVSSKVANAVKQVIGEAVYYNGSYANTTYCAANAGVSNSSVDVWGGNVPYLVSVESEGDEECIYYGKQTRLSEDYVAKQIKAYYNENPYDYGDPDEWFGKYSYGEGKYISKIKVCGQNLSGRYVRETLLQYKIASAAFEVEYDSKKEEFVFTTYGYGHGVGMSQLGANYYAKCGWTYDEILEHYYKNTQVR